MAGPFHSMSASNFFLFLPNQAVRVGAERLRPNAAMMNMTESTTSESPQVTDHVTFAEALTKDAVFKQDYSCVVVWAGDVHDVTLKDGSGTKKVQDLKLDDGTADLRYSMWGGGKINVGQGVEITQAYIKKNNDGYYDLKVASAAKGGSVRFTPTSKVVASKKADKANLHAAVEDGHWTDGRWCTRSAGETGTIQKTTDKDAVIKIPVPAEYAAKWKGKERGCKAFLSRLFTVMWQTLTPEQQKTIADANPGGIEAIDWDDPEATQ